VQQQRLGEFLTHWLSRAEADVAELIIREGLDNKAIGERLGRSNKTVANQLTSIYNKLAEFLQLTQGNKANRHLLIATFAVHLSRKQVGR
jgi:CRISPR-associated protein Csx14